MDPAVTALQSAINRFAAVGGFPSVAVDGLWGSATLKGTQNALIFVAQGKCYKSACVDDDTARTAAGLLEQWDQTMSAARGLADFLAGVADGLGMPHVASPIPSGGSIPGKIVVAPAAFTMGFLDKFKLMPIWQQVLIGIAAGLGLIFVVNKVKAVRAPAKRAKGAR